MNPDLIGGAVRTVLATLGGIAVGFGLISQEENAELVATTGLVVSAAIGIWSLWQKFKQRAVVKTALMTPPPKGN